MFEQLVRRVQCAQFLHIGVYRRVNGTRSLGYDYHVNSSDTLYAVILGTLVTSGSTEIYNLTT